MNINIQLGGIQSDSAVAAVIIQFVYPDPVCEVEENLLCFELIAGFFQRGGNTVEKPSGNAFDRTVMVKPPEKKQETYPDNKQNLMADTSFFLPVFFFFDEFFFHGPVPVVDI